MSVPFQQLRYRSQQKKTSALNLVALMDIFTVLVFFLLFNVHSEQALNVSDKVKALPLSTQAIDRLTMSSTFEVLEVPSRKMAYFNGEAVSLDKSLMTLSSRMKASCVAKKEKRCRRLAIEAPADMPYSYVNQFVELGSHLNFENVYLVVTQNKVGG
ncbi:biopolymer transporter ExbD [Aliivibrio sifiae]